MKRVGTTILVDSEWYVAIVGTWVRFKKLLKTPLTLRNILNTYLNMENLFETPHSDR